MKKGIFLMVVFVLAAMAVPAGASHGTKGAGFDRNIASVPDLNLTEAQSAKIATLKTSFLTDVKPLRDKLFSKRGDLKLLWREKNPDQAKILAAQKQIRVLRGQIQDRVTTYRLSVRKVLSDEQRDKLKAYRQNRGFAGHGGRLAAYLRLSPEQKDKMRALKNSYRSETKDLRYDLAAKRLEMRKLFTDPKAEEAALLAKQKEVNGLREQLAEKRSLRKLEWRKILTPEQIAKLDRMPHSKGFPGRSGGRWHRFGA